jgi:hypothetical protein
MLQQQQAGRASAAQPGRPVGEPAAAHLRQLLPPLLLRLLLELLQRHLLHLALLGLRLPLEELLLGGLVADAPARQVPARVEVGRDLAVPALPPQQRAEAALAAQQPRGDVHRAVRGHALRAEGRLIEQLP